MLDMDDDSQRITVVPPLDDDEVRLLGGLAGVGEGPRRVWPGQPGRRSPWLTCNDGCCLVLESRPHLGAASEPATWLRFLVREVLAPRAAAPRARAAELGLSGGHRLDGRVLLDVDGPRPVMVVVSGNRVREMPLDDDLFPLERPPPKKAGEVVSLERTSRSGQRGGQRADWWTSRVRSAIAAQLNSSMARCRPARPMAAARSGSVTTSVRAAAKSAT